MSPVQKLARAFAPRFLLESRRLWDLVFVARLLPSALYDVRRFLRYSGVNRFRDNPIEKAARITVMYHQVEKGLSLPSPRSNFGMTYIPRLLEGIDEYFARHGVEAPATQALASLSAYVRFHEQKGLAADWVKGRVEEICSRHQIDSGEMQRWPGGTRVVRRRDLETSRHEGFPAFFESRHSVRDWAGGAIPESDLRRAVQLAQKTPSVCNRQAWRVHAYRDPEKIRALLAIQKGSAGFGDEAALLLVITCELGCFLSVGERYQAWIDGGMFAMSLCLAIHDLGYGACCLNWSKTAHEDRALRHVAALPDSEQVIMLVASGNLREEFVVAFSGRASVDRCLVNH